MGVTTLYRWYDADDRLLYVGITERGDQRFKEHRKGSGWWEHAVRSTVEHFSTRLEAKAAETRVIKTERPVWNVDESSVDPFLFDLCRGVHMSHGKPIGHFGMMGKFLIRRDYPELYAAFDVDEPDELFGFTIVGMCESRGWARTEYHSFVNVGYYWGFMVYGTDEYAEEYETRRTLLSRGSLI